MRVYDGLLCKHAPCAGSCAAAVGCPWAMDLGIIVMPSITLSGLAHLIRPARRVDGDRKSSNPAPSSPLRLRQSVNR
jgi:hypothetical protein